MGTQNNKALSLIARLKTTNENYVKYSGLGYCADASVQLQKDLDAIGIKGKLIFGKHLSDNPAGNKAKAHFKNLVANFPIGNDFHGRVKRHFVNNKNQLSDKGGHVAVLVGETIYDVTSAQFGLPITYPLDVFLGMWDTAAIVSVKIKPNRTSWSQAMQYSYKNKDKSNISQESFGESIEWAMESIIDDTDLNTDREDFYRWYATQSKQVQSNSTIVAAQDIGQDYMLHIDKQTPAVFVPRMPTSAASSENDTSARVTVAAHLIGCIIGYARVESDLLAGTDKSVVKRTGFRGGYDICTLPFKHCLLPNEKLVYDAQRSHEHWLVSYNKETLEYIPTKVGKVFVSRVTYEPVTGKDPVAMFELYVEVNKEDGFKFSPDVYLDKGFYFITMGFDREKHQGSADDDNDLKVEKIDAVQYNRAKQLSAAMLSHKDSSPKYLNW